MRILVTGGAGYVGCHATRILLEHGHEVRVLDRFCYGREVAARLEQHPDCTLIPGDIRRLQEHEGLFDGVEAVLHLAGLANNPSCSIDPQLTDDVNVESAAELARQAIEHGVRRFVMTSSCDVYGKGRLDLLTEESEAAPVSPYGESKVRAEQAVLGLGTRRFEPVIARGGSYFGVSDRMRYDLALNAMTASAMKDGLIRVLGRGQQWRPFLHVADAAEALVMLLEAPAEDVADEIFNIGATDLNYQVIDLANFIAERIEGTKVEIVASDEDSRTYRVDCSKFQRQFDWTPSRSLDDGINEIRAAAKPGFEPFSEMHVNVLRLRTLLATPVDEGGEPVAPRFIPLARPMMDEDEERVTIDTMRSGWLGAGPYVGQFESALGELLEAKHVVGIQNCTSAIHLCLAHLGIGPGDEVILPPITWASVGNIIVNMGATPVFADVDAETINLDPASVKARITPNTRAIVPVHHAGWSCDMDALRAVAGEIPIVEDAAHALGARYKGRPVGSDSRLACFSFHAIKNITTMEGGAITAASAEEASRLRMLARNGMRENSWERYGRSSIAAPVEVVAPGFKYAMGNVAAAIGLVQLKKLPRFFAKRRWLAQLYRRELARFDEIALPRCDDPEEHAWHLLIIRLRLDRLTVDRTAFADLLRRENVGTGFHFWGLHLHEFYRERYNIDPASLPNATAVSNDILSLPLFPGMTDKNVADIIRAIEKVLTHTRKRG